MKIAALDGVMPFPNEIVRLICEFAAERDQSTAYALALTSKSVCQWTAEARWRTVSITSLKQLISFWSIIYAMPEEIVEGFWKLHEIKGDQNTAEMSKVIVQDLYGLQEIVEKLKEPASRTVKGISFPLSGPPHTYINNLFVDVTKENSLADESTKQTVKTCRIFFESLLGRIWGIFLDPLFFLSRWNGEASSLLERVSLGPLELSRLIPQFGPSLPIRELTITLSDGMERFNFQASLPKSLERLHVIGACVNSPSSGVTPPWSLFKSLSTPYMEDRDPRIPHTPTISKFRLTHIRYDTRRFSFKPAEITAKRMGPLFRELTFTPTESNLPNKTSAQEATASFQFDGPRHAAPSRGAGNLSRLQSTSNLVPIHKLAQQGDPVAKYMFEIGVGQLAFFQLAWEPMTGSKEMLNSVQPWYKRKADYDGKSQNDETDSREAGADHGMRDDTGGWPRERRGAWTERSERTIDSFGAELRDAIESMWGWHGHEIEAAGRYCKQLEEGGTENAPFQRNSAFSPNADILSKETIEANPDLYKRESVEMRKVIALIKERVPTCELSHPQFAANDGSPLCFGIRAPRSLVHLGGKASLTYHDRLLLFYDRANGGKGPWP